MVDFNNSEQVINVSEDLLSFVSGQTFDAFKAIGIGIGAIMLLLVVIHSMIAILDGGKFQMKMLLPLLIFFFVCNFSWVSAPVTSFTNTLTKAACQSFQGAKSKLLKDESDGHARDIGGLFWYKKKQKDNEKYAEYFKLKKMEEESGKISGDQGANEGIDMELAEEQRKKYFWNEVFNMGNPIKALNKWVNNLIDKKNAELLASMDTDSTSDESEEKTYSYLNLSFSGMCVSLLSFLANIISLALRSLGIVMTALVIAFGPITFAFAVWPGKGSMIVSWFLRICQFALYAPICMFLDVIILKVFILMYSGADGVMGTVMVLGVLLASVVAFTSVPSIASMIIEGAQGGISLSQGLQTLAGGLTAGGAVVSTAWNGVMGQNNALGNFMSGLDIRGVTGFVSEAKAHGTVNAMRQMCADGQRAHMFNYLGSNENGGAGNAPTGSAMSDEERQRQYQRMNH